MTNSQKKIYSGQAIAIIMVILVVATVLGASLYSRTLKNREAAINTKDSMKAVEQADSLLDLFVRADFQFLQSLAQEIQTTGKEEVFESTAEIKSFLAEYDVNTSMLDQGVVDWCEYDKDKNPSSNLKLTIAEAQPSDFVDVRVGSARVFNLEGNETKPNAPCSMALKFEAREKSPTIFVIKKIYGNPSGEIAEYVNDGSTDDMEAYCFTPTSLGCTSDQLQGVAAPEGSFLSLNANNTVALDLKETRGSFPLYQIRVIPLNNTVGISHSDVSGCSEKLFSYMKVNAAVNCYGSFREKQIMVPGADSLGYSSLFDYTIYNIGTLRPNN